MTTAREHIALYGRVRKALLSGYFALGRFFRNDFFQELIDTPRVLRRAGRRDADKERARRAKFANKGAAAIRPSTILCKKGPSDRDNPWLFGSKFNDLGASRPRRASDCRRRSPFWRQRSRSCEQLFNSRGNSAAFRCASIRLPRDDWLDRPGGVSR